MGRRPALVFWLAVSRVATAYSSDEPPQHPSPGKVSSRRDHPQQVLEPLPSSVAERASSTSGDDGKRQGVCDPHKTSTLVFVKLHQVGSGTAMALLEELLKTAGDHPGQNPLLDRLLDGSDGHHLKGGASRTIIINHQDSAKALEGWIKHGNSIPHDVCAMTILRDPSERFLSTFFKGNYDIPKDADVGTAIQKRHDVPAFDKYLSPKNPKHADHSWSSAFKHKDAISQYLAESLLPKIAGKREKLGRGTQYEEYQGKFQSVTVAKALLPQFKVVGLTEDEDGALRHMCTALHVPDDDCDTAIAAAKANPLLSHHFPAHPSVSFFDADLQAKLASTLDGEWQIYNHTKSMLGMA